MMCTINLSYKDLNTYKGIKMVLPATKSMSITTYMREQDIALACVSARVYTPGPQSRLLPSPLLTSSVEVAEPT